MRSGAPPSSTLTWAVSAQMTASHGRHTARIDTTLAPEPLKTSKRLRPLAEVAAQHLERPRGPRIGPVGDGVAVVGLRHRGQHVWVRACVIVGGEGLHRCRAYANSSPGAAQPLSQHAVVSVIESLRSSSGSGRQTTSSGPPGADLQRLGRHATSSGARPERGWGAPDCTMPPASRRPTARPAAWIAPRAGDADRGAGDPGPRPRRGAPDGHAGRAPHQGRDLPGLPRSWCRRAGRCTGWRPRPPRVCASTATRCTSGARPRSRAAQASPRGAPRRSWSSRLARGPHRCSPPPPPPGRPAAGTWPRSSTEPIGSSSPRRGTVTPR